MATTFTSTPVVVRRDSVLWSNLSLGLALVTAVLLHSYNMFNFPLYQGDEGIYMARAYAILKLGWPTPYTYWYDHAPAGWLFIALWSALSGGFYTFGTAIDSGRVFILLLHLASVVLIFRIVLRLTHDAFAGLIAGLLYTLSPLALMYGRMVLLDNIMIFWALLATALLLQHQGKLWAIFNSGLCFGLAVLTKENAFLFLPAFLYGLWTLADKNHTRFARAGWLYMAIFVISLYPLYAALRTELIDLNLSSPLAGDGGSISLLGSIFWQFGRSGGAPWQPSSDFFRLLTGDWLVKDPWLLGLGAAATLWNIVRGDHARRLIALLSLLSLISLARGGTVFDFYIISVVPFLALNASLAVADLAKLTRSPSLAPVAVVAVVALSWFNLDQQRYLFTLDLTTLQRQALTWVRDHVPANAQLVINDDLWVDLRDGGPAGQKFPGTHSHWQVAYDPAVYHDLFNEDWRIIDYLILPPGVAQILTDKPDSLTYQAYRHSTVVANFTTGTATVEIRKVNHAGIAVHDMVKQSYTGFINRYVHSGQVVAPSGYTDARDQAAALLMAVWMDDQETFDQLWNWTFMHLQSETGLLYHTNEPGVTLHTATDADTDAALALLLAQKRWKNAAYGRHAQKIIRAIWKYEVVQIRGKPYLAAGDWAVNKQQVIFAPATFAPYAYHFFAAADPDHNWWYLLDTTYQLLAEVSGDSRGEPPAVGLPPAYVGIDRRTGAFRPNPANGPTSGHIFDEQAAQVYWRVGLDAQWHDDDRADNFLTASSFLRDEWQATGNLASSYDPLGRRHRQGENLTLYSAVLSKLLIEAPETAHELYAAKIVTAYHQSQDEGYWGDGTDIIQERWAWLATALYANTLQYQWEAEAAKETNSHPGSMPGK